MRWDWVERAYPPGPRAAPAGAGGSAVRSGLAVDPRYARLLSTAGLSELVALWPLGRCITQGRGHGPPDGLNTRGTLRHAGSLAALPE
jgi:hypothetical protein